MPGAHESARLTDETYAVGADTYVGRPTRLYLG